MNSDQKNTKPTPKSVAPKGSSGGIGVAIGIATNNLRSRFATRF